MPRSARLDAPGVLHHIMIRGIEHRNIFRNNEDRDDFLERLSIILPETNTSCYAWALLSNHAHFLFRSGEAGISKVMRRLLTGYAVTFNHKYKRHGQLFQNRYKSIICQEDAYLKELVRYIHLNPLRAKLVSDISELNGYPYCGHSALIGKRHLDWQDTRYVLGNFGKSVKNARNEYLDFVEKEGLYSGSRKKAISEARSLFCYWCVRELGESMTHMASLLGITQPAIGYAIERGELLAKKNKYNLLD